MTQKQHPKIHNQILAVYKDANERAKAYATLAHWVDQYNLHTLIDHAQHFHINADTMSQIIDGERRTVNVDRWWATVRVDAEHKAELRSILLAAFDTFEKGYNVDNYNWHKGPLLLEIWTHQWGRIDNPVGADAYNAIHIQFESPASEGQQLSDTCSIGRVTDQPTASTRLVVTCRREEKKT